VSADVVFADADVIIDFFKGVEPMASRVERLIVERRLRLPSAVAFELRAGVVDPRRLAAIDRLVQAVHVIPFGLGEARLAAAQFTAQKGKGTLIGNTDLMIAATCLLAGAPLLTSKATHFERIDGLKLFAE
jgi:tRNA(fMet)-specific endonuclease VapC